MAHGRKTSVLRVVLLLISEAAAVVALHRLGGAQAANLGWGDLGAWLRQTSPEDAVTAVARLLGLAGSYWLLATTGLYLLGRAARLPVLVAGVRWATLPGVRRLVDGAVAASIVAGSVVGGGAAYAADRPPVPPPPVVVQLGPPPVPVSAVLGADGHVYVPIPAGDIDAGRGSPAASRGAQATTSTAKPTTTTMKPTTTTLKPTTTTIAKPAPGPSTTAASSVGRPAPARQVAAPSEAPAGVLTYVVKADDDLWHLAARRVAAANGLAEARLGTGEIARYWRQLVAANQDRVRSGDPSLIYPGEELVLPPLG